MAMNAYQRVFGGGPLGFVLSLALLYPAKLIAAQTPQWSLDLPYPVRIAALVMGIVVGGAVLIASLRDLPPDQRGKELCTSGIFGYLRHPLYAAFLSGINLGFAVYLNHAVYLLWALALHPMWHIVMHYEERLMLNEFGDDYRQYAERTGRFVPRLRPRRSKNG